MLRIRKIHDDRNVADRNVIGQVQEILRSRFPETRAEDIAKIPLQLNDPTRFGYRSVLFVAETASGKVRGFAMLLHLQDVEAAFLELVSTAKGDVGGGIGGTLYESAREEAAAWGVRGLFFECSVDDPSVVTDPGTLEDNRRRLRFYENFGARPIANNAFDSPVHPGDRDLYFLMYDDLGRTDPLRRETIRPIVRAILDRKYAGLMSRGAIEEVVASFADEVVRLRPPIRARRPRVPGKPVPALRKIALLVNASHDIHHIRDRGYVEAPVRIPVILAELDKTQLFVRVAARPTPRALILEAHNESYLDYLRDACASLPAGKSIYPIVFPVRNVERPPKDLELQLGYYCTDTFTPLNANVYPAARGAVDCAVTAAKLLFEDFDIAYALVRPPGHHAERRVFGGFCYLNNAAVAAHYLSAYGRVAMLDVDFHHGNGQQDIFYDRPDVLTVSIHSAPPAAYPHYAGFADERGTGPGEGFNLNFPLPAQITPARYDQVLRKALAAIRAFAPSYLVVCLGLDTAKSDPTGTWPLRSADFHANGRLIGELGLPTVIVQEGGYRTRTLGINARSFFEGLWATHSSALAMGRSRVEGRPRQAPKTSR